MPQFKQEKILYNIGVVQKDIFLGYYFNFNFSFWIMFTGFLTTRFQRLFFVFYLVTFFGLTDDFVAAQGLDAAKSLSPSFTPRLVNLEAASNETFRYNASLQNNAKEHVYELSADLPNGWLISFRTEGSQVTSVRMEPNKFQDISIEINPSYSAKPDKYTIPVRAISPDDTLSFTLEAVVKGSYQIELTTPTGRLSEEVVAGSSKSLQLVLKNSGTLPLNDVDLTSQLPTQWECKFEPANFKQLEPGKSVDVTATIQVPEKTLAGDYMAKLNAKNANSHSEVSFRIVVKTSLLSGWIGMLVILLAVALVYYLIRKYGRR